MGLETLIREAGGWRSLYTGRTLEQEPVEVSITHGRQITPAKVGIAALGIDESQLQKTSLGTFTASGQVIEGKWFTGGTVLAGNGITLRGCIIEAQGSDAKAVRIPGANVTLENCLIRSRNGGSFYVGVEPGVGTTVRRCDVSQGENLMTSISDGVVIEENYLHHVSNASNPSGHRDVLEVYAGTDVTVRRNRLWHGDEYETAVINVAPWGTTASVDNLLVEDNFIDGAALHIIIDLQAAQGHIHNTRILRNDFGGHTFPGYGIYNALLNSESRPLLNTETQLLATPDGILWPATGPDVNRWAECSDLVPDRTGEVAYPGNDGL